MAVAGFLAARLELFITSPTDFLLLWRELELPTLSVPAEPVLTDMGDLAGAVLWLRTLFLLGTLLWLLLVFLFSL